MNTNPLDWISAELEGLDRQNLRRELRRRESPHVAGIVQLDGVQYANFGSNDYLSLAADSRLVDEVKMHVGYVGWGSGASPLISGRGVLHARLEEELARFEGAEAALLFPTGYAANVSTITSLVGRRDTVFSDSKNHASIIDGCRLSGADISIYRHNDVEHLQTKLRGCSRGGRRLIVTDALFSMDGDLAPLKEIVELADEYNTMLLVDEAHATGVFGESGRGVTEHFGCESPSVIRVGTLSKALGSIGGFVSGPQSLIDWISNRARTYIFSTAMPEAMAAPTIEALKIIASEPYRRTQLLANADRVRSALSEMGWSTGTSTSQIIPIMVGSAARTMEITDHLMRDGIFVPGIRPPSVPDGESLLRISLCYDHTDEAIDKLLDCLRKHLPAK